MCDDLYQILPPPDYQIFFVISSLVNKIERPTSYNIYVGISFTMLINAPLVIQKSGTKFCIYSKRPPPHPKNKKQKRNANDTRGTDLA